MQDLPPTTYPDDPIYNMKAVTQRTGIPAATLRAWERRYHALAPRRSDGNYRLYSERDIAVLRWLQTQLDAGLSISRAVALLERLRQREGAAPATHPADDGAGVADSEQAAGQASNRATASAPEHAMRGQAPERPESGPRGLHLLAYSLHDALIQGDEQQAATVLAEAFALYSVEDVCMQAITPSMVRVGDDWHAGRISVATEHFATAYLLARLLALFNAQPARHGPLVLVACAPGERHEMGALILALFLRRAGRNVRYLGADVPLVELLRSIREWRPRVVMLSALLADAAARLIELPGMLRGPEAAVQVVLGGQAFTDEALARHFPPGSNYNVAGSDIPVALNLIDRFLAG
jgi:MerR family transcriptional regulator, light-induced transcriptional regulator